MYSKKLILTAFTLLFTQCIHSIPVNMTKRMDIDQFWDGLCDILDTIDISDKVGKFSCGIGKIGLSLIDGKDSEISLHQIPPGQCDEVYVGNAGVTEVCSSPPYQLYFPAVGYEVYGCYHDGPGSKYYQCCQFRHDLQTVVPNGPVGMAQQIPYLGKFCSGPKSDDSSYKNVYGHGLTFNLNPNQHQLLYYRMNSVEEECSKDLYSDKCKEAESNLERTIKRKIEWKTNAKV